MAAKSTDKKPAAPVRVIDVFLVDRKAAIQAVASGAVDLAGASINLNVFKQWALRTGQPDGAVINGVRIAERNRKG